MSDTQDPRPARWARRKEAMAYGRIGSTKMNELLRTAKLHAKKDGAKVIINLNSVDDYIESLPDAARPAVEDAA